MTFLRTATGSLSQRCVRIAGARASSAILTAAALSSPGWQLQSRPTDTRSVCCCKVRFLSSSLRSTDIHLCRQSY